MIAINTSKNNYVIDMNISKVMRLDLQLTEKVYVTI